MLRSLRRLVVASAVGLLDPSVDSELNDLSCQQTIGHDGHFWCSLSELHELIGKDFVCFSLHFFVCQHCDTSVGVLVDHTTRSFVSDMEFA